MSNSFFLLAIGLCAAVPLLIALPHRWRLLVGAAIWVPQFYLPGLPLTCAQIWLILTALLGFVERRHERNRKSPRSWLLTVALLLLIVRGISMLWASPDGMSSAITENVQLAAFLIIGYEVLAITSSSTKERTVEQIILAMWPTMAILCGMIWAFRLSPSLENSFLHSQVVQYLIGPSGPALFTTSPNNVLDALKSGGLFVNANVASMFCGAMAFITLSVAVRRRSRWIGLLAGIALATAFATGSKSPIAIAIILGTVMVLAPVALRTRYAYFAFLGLIAAAAIVYPAVSTVGGVLNNSGTAEVSSGQRIALWSAAADMFPSAPLLGLGYGGWANHIGSYIGRTDYPPHNVIIAAWANSGILAAILTTLFVIGVFVVTLNTARSQPTPSQLVAALAAGSALAWMQLHAMADNTTIYGEQHAALIAAAAIAFLASDREQPAHKAPANMPITRKRTGLTRNMPGRSSAEIQPPLAQASSRSRKVPTEND